MAVDGSDLHIATNPDDKGTYFQNHPCDKGFNLMHLNAMYDLCNRFYVDALIQPGRHTHEKKALVDMVDRSAIKGNVIVIADRSYEYYNSFAHIENKGWKYVIRAKDLASNGILSGLSLPFDSEFDLMIQRILTRRQTKDSPSTSLFADYQSVLFVCPFFFHSIKKTTAQAFHLPVPSFF